MRVQGRLAQLAWAYLELRKSKEDPRNRQLNAVGRFAQLIHKYRLYHVRRHRLMVTARWGKLARKYARFKEGVRRVKIVGKFSKFIRRYVNYREMAEQQVLRDDEEAAYQSPSSDRRRALLKQTDVEHEKEGKKINVKENKRHLIVLGKLALLLRRYALRRFAERRLERLGKLAVLSRKYLIRHKKLTKMRAQQRWTSFAKRLLYPDK